MSQISTVSPNEASRQGQGAARPSAKGHAAGHPLFAGLLEQADLGLQTGLGLQADPGGLPLNPAMALGGDVATDAGDDTPQEELELADWSLLGLPLIPVAQESAPPTEALPESTTTEILSPSAEELSASDLEPAANSADALPEGEQPDAATAVIPDTEPSSSRSEPPPSTVSKARRSAVSIAAQQHAQATSAARLDLQGWNMAPQSPSTASQLQTSAAAALNAAPLAEASLSTGLGGGAADNGPQGQEPGPFQRQAGEPAGRVENPGLSTATPAADAAAPKGFALSLGRAMGDAFSQLGTQISVWASQNMKRASISLDTGLGKALDVDVSLQDGQAHLAFRTDDAAARAALQNHAQQVMADLLARNGLGLAGLSIGARGQEGQPGQDGERGGNHRGIRGMGSGAAEPETTPTQWVARPGRALDVYA